MPLREDDESEISETRHWLQPISNHARSSMRHLVPTEGWLVKALCGHWVNLRFAKPSNGQKCRVCERLGR